MKRLIAAVSFAVVAGPALAAGLPYEQNLVDRALPEIKVDVRADSAPRFGAPYDQTVVDRAQPNVETRRTRVAAFAGDIRSDVEISTDAPAESPWSGDHSFIAPAQ